MNAANEKMAKLMKAVNYFSLFFSTGNGVPPNAKTLVSTAEWQAIHADFKELEERMAAVSLFTAGAGAGVAPAGTAGYPAGPQSIEAFPWNALCNVVGEVIEQAAKNGAGSVGMPDDYVALAFLTCYPERTLPHPGAPIAPVATAVKELAASAQRQHQAQVDGEGEGVFPGRRWMETN